MVVRTAMARRKRVRLSPEKELAEGGGGAGSGNEAAEGPREQEGQEADGRAESGASAGGSGHREKGGHDSASGGAEQIDKDEEAITDRQSPRDPFEEMEEVS